MTDPRPIETEEETFRRLLATLDIQTPTRYDWRGICRGAERATWQQYLLRIAQGARVGAKTDRLILYKAAYAVLPLHGRDLEEFVALLVEERPQSLEWSDALIAALSEQPHAHSRLAGPILEALEDVCRQAQKGEESGKRRIATLCFHIRRLGYTPSWLAHFTKT